MAADITPVPGPDPLATTVAAWIAAEQAISDGIGKKIYHHAGLGCVVYKDTDGRIKKARVTPVDYTHTA